MLFYNPVGFLFNLNQFLVVLEIKNENTHTNRVGFFIGVWGSGSPRAWGACSPSSILGIPTKRDLAQE